MKWLKRIATAVIVLVAIGGAGYLISSRMMNYDKLSERERAAREEKENAISGQWEAGDTLVCDIWRDGDGIFHGTVTRTEDASTVSFWECSGPWSDADDGFTYTNGIRYTTTYGKAGEAEDGETRTVYENGRGSFCLKDGKVYWDDREEHAADKQPFTYIGEY